MKDPVLRVVLFPRPTAIWGTPGGTTVIYTEPMNVKDFAQAIVAVGRGTGMGSTPATGDLTVWQSADMIDWYQVGSVLAPAAGGEATGTFDLDLEWFRTGASVSGSVPGLTMWATVTFVPRVPSAP